MCDCCSFGPPLDSDADQLVIEKMIPSKPGKLQPALPLNEIQEIAPPDDVKAKVTLVPPIDMFFDPKEQAIMLLMDLPGASKDDICIEIGEGLLSICGPRSKNELKERFGGQLHIMAHERQTGYYCRRFQLPSNANEDMISAQFNAGVLELKFKCVQWHERRRVDIGVIPGEKPEKKSIGR
ncbi:heat shock 22 kDa protein, chloroplastic [Cyclospora cayetanensis]|uniref:Small heat shock protein n=2 Tax=Cyclospora cayetanensis TaxID=88456 RepID=A0A1D3CS79_9EIME|nr:heat shock 22 kDa protein, chloroplastic [Cyclospora cayetanensis]OEH74057.1 small heat shock protein [Cyclospora cayetanensis]